MQGDGIAQVQQLPGAQIKYKSINKMKSIDELLVSVKGNIHVLICKYASMRM